jgi:plastocyanin
MVERIPKRRRKGSMGRLTYLGALALMLVVLIAPSAGAKGQHATGHQTATIVYIRDFYFSPAKIAVEPGTTVTWVNLGRHPHTVTSFDGQFDSGTLMPGDSYKVKFVGHGKLGYYCAIHPSMTGSVGVGTPSGTPSGTPAVSGGASTMGGGTMGGGGGGQPMGGQPMPMPSRY